MKAVILAGGLGTRLSEETHLKPKPMVEVGGKPILWHILKNYSHFGINEFIICCGYKGYLIKEYFANYFLHTSDVTFHMDVDSHMEVHHRKSEPWKITHQASHAISFSGSMSYNRGRAFSLATTTHNLRMYRQSWRTRLWRLITFIRYSLHGEIAPSEARRLWGDNTSTLSFWTTFPVALVLAMKDRLQGKVRMTHREFLAGKDTSHYSIEVLSKGVTS